MRTITLGRSEMWLWGVRVVTDVALVELRKSLRLASCIGNGNGPCCPSSSIQLNGPIDDHSRCILRRNPARSQPFPVRFC